MPRTLPSLPDAPLPAEAAQRIRLAAALPLLWQAKLPRRQMDESTRHDKDSLRLFGLLVPASPRLTFLLDARGRVAALSG
jgi:hypothetical protein